MDVDVRMKPRSCMPLHSSQCLALIPTEYLLRMSSYVSPRVPHRTPAVRPSAERELIPPSSIKLNGISRRTTTTVAQGCSVIRGHSESPGNPGEAQSQRWQVSADTPGPHAIEVAVDVSLVITFVCQNM